MKPSPAECIMFDLIDEGPRTVIARGKDKMIGEAMWDNYLPRWVAATSPPE